MNKSIAKLSGVTAAVLMALSFNVNAADALSTSGNISSVINIADNKLSTRWVAKENGRTKSLEYQFAGTPTITSINIAFYQGDVTNTNIGVQSSNDGLNWSAELSSSSSGFSKDLETFELNSPISSRYIRIIGIANSSAIWDRITEVTFNGSGLESEIEKAGPMTAIDSDGDDVAEVLDDNLKTYWSTKGKGKWFRVDLGRALSLNRAKISFHKGNVRQSKFNVEVSNDDHNWTNVLSNRVSAGNSLNEEIFLFDQVRARYVRYVGSGNTSRNSSAWNSVTEFSADYKAPKVAAVRKPAVLAAPVVSAPVIKQTTNKAGSRHQAKGCELRGQMELNGDCVNWLSIYESEHGKVGENDHLISRSPIEMKFNALAAQHETRNGNGWRHELKIKSSGGYRVGMTEVYEVFKARITANLSNGSKTIVAQHHAATTATITKLYIADQKESGFQKAPDGSYSDSRANNGIFDVYIRLAKPDGSGETKHLLTKIKSGESFDFEEINDHGKITVKINGQALPTITVNDSSASYFKFGNYHQAQEKFSGEKVRDKGDWPDFYKRNFSESEIIFTNMSYIRNLD